MLEVVKKKMISEVELLLQGGLVSLCLFVGGYVERCV